MAGGGVDSTCGAFGVGRKYLAILCKHRRKAQSAHAVASLLEQDKVTQRQSAGDKLSLALL